METKEFRFIKNMLWPVKSTIAVGPEGITQKGATVAWDDIVSFSYGITVINGAPNYVIGYDDKRGKGHTLNFIVSMLGSKKKKALLEELYGMLHEGFTTHHVAPRSKELAARVEAGETVELQGCKVSPEGVEIQKGMIKQEKVFIPAADVTLGVRPGTGGFDISSSQHAKTMMHISFQGGAESRYLLAVLNQLYPDQALNVA